MTKPKVLLASPKPPPPRDLWITGLTLITGGTEPSTNDATLVLREGRIVYAGSAAGAPEVSSEGLMVDGSDFVAIPGLINAHTHSAMGFFRGLGHGRPNLIEEFLFPAEASLTAELLEPLSYSYIYAGIKAGVTCFADHYYFSAGIARALERFGVRGVVGETVADLGGAFPSKTVWEKARQKIETWGFSRRIVPALAPHAADTVSAALLSDMGAYAAKNNLPLHMHLSQTQGERDRVLQREGLSPVAFAERCGALTPQTLAVHLVSADAADIEILARTGATAGFCPASQIIYEKLAPIEKFMEANIPVALGTDCAASNDGADMMSEMRLAALLARDRGRPDASALPRQVLAMATSNPARTFGLGDILGTLTAGKAADVVFLRRDLGTEPWYQADVNLVFSMNSSHVRHVMVDGAWILWDGELAAENEQDLRETYLEAVEQIAKRIGRG